MNVRAASLSQRPRAAVDGGAGREDIIDENMSQGGIKAGSRSQCKGIFEIKLALPPAKGRLAWCILEPPKEGIHPRPSPGPACQGSRQQLALVKPALAQLSGVQRHRDQHAPLGPLKGLGAAAKDFLRIAQEMPTPAVFQIDDERPHRTPEKGGGAPRSVGGPQPPAMGALPRPLHGPGKRMPAHCAVGRQDEVDLGGTGRTNVPIRSRPDQSPAVHADRGKHDVGNALDELPDPHE